MPAINLERVEYEGKSVGNFLFIYFLFFVTFVDRLQIQRTGIIKVPDRSGSFLISPSGMTIPKVC